MLIKLRRTFAFQVDYFINELIAITKSIYMYILWEIYTISLKIPVYCLEYSIGKATWKQLLFSAKSRKLPLNIKRFDQSSPFISVDVITKAISIRRSGKSLFQIIDTTLWNPLSQTETFQLWDHEILFHRVRVIFVSDLMHERFEWLVKANFVLCERFQMWYKRMQKDSKKSMNGTVNSFLTLRVTALRLWFCYFGQW